MDFALSLIGFGVSALGQSWLMLSLLSMLLLLPVQVPSFLIRCCPCHLRAQFMHESSLMEGSVMGGSPIAGMVFGAYQHQSGSFIGHGAF